MTVKDYSRIFVRYDLVTESPYYSIKRVAGENTAIQKVLESVILGDTENIEEVVNAALRELDPVEVIYHGLLKGMNEVSRLWDEGIYYLPQTLLASDTMLVGLQICENKLGCPVRKRGLVVTHTAEGDIHDLGQKIVNVLLRASGFEVIDLGKDVPVDRVVQAVREHKPDLLCGTAHLTTTMGVFKQISDALQREGISVPFACGGGGGVNLSFITSFALGIYGKDASLAPKMAKDAHSGMSWEAIRKKYNG
ncbi:methanol corrinoid protein [Desulfotomaculum arcticum]|uniref:Methanol corrinoid protein n=1 Tax=Desulfotruncus arcticus DSM 17038 TaxID=1121424 RepID=A0A1I2WSY7_9FIRM|nr:cobalamin-dependent protein [Desulfotruncus arcticus]SFH04405.1 methanol corrinoid protein [Desulfotomaculum arcticum] [Desulfotruncus arcticus DSM 17038]